MGFDIILASIGFSIGISAIDFAVLAEKDHKTTKKIIKKYNDYDYLVINKFNLRSKLQKEIFNNYKIKNVDEDDITLFYVLTLVPLTNIMFLYAYITKNEELDLPFNLCVEKCLDKKIIKKLIGEEIIKDDDWLEKADKKSLILERRT